MTPNQLKSEDLFQEGLIFLTIGIEKKLAYVLKQAIDRFQQATQFNPHLYAAWHAWAIALRIRYELFKTQKDLWQARAKIEKALSSPLPLPEFYTEAATIHHLIALLSGEINDLMCAIAYLEKIPEPFWDEIGANYLTLFNHMNQPYLLLKAVECFKKNNRNQEMAKAFRSLYHLTYEQDYLQEALKCATFSPLEQIELLIEGARIEQDIQQLHLALDKCEESSSHPKEFRLLGLWAEALALLGEWEQQVEPIYRAEKLMNEALDLVEDDIFLLLQQGKVMFYSAKYFQDLDLYYQAIEQFQAAASMDRTEIQAWIWMGKTSMAISDQFSDLDALEMALRFYQKAFYLRPLPILHFEIGTILIKLGEIQQKSAVVKQGLTYLDYLMQIHPSVFYKRPHHLFQYAVALDTLGDLTEEVSLHKKSLGLLTTLLIFDPNYPSIHQYLGVVYFHIGELLDDISSLYQAVQHFHLGHQKQPDEETFYIDWAITWIHISEHTTDPFIEKHAFAQAESKLLFAAQLGNQASFYQLACLYALQKDFELSLRYLHKAHQAKALPPLEEIQEDAWLESLRLHPEFQQFLSLLEKHS